MNDRLEIAARILAAFATDPKFDPEPGYSHVSRYVLKLADALIAEEKRTRNAGATT